MFNRTEEQAMIEQALERFVSERYSLAQRSQYMREQVGFSQDNWTFLAELGLLGLPFSEAYGGFGGTLEDVSLVMMSLGKGLVLEPYLQTVVIAGRLLAHCQEEAFKALWLEQLIAGEKLIGLAHYERSIPDFRAVNLTLLSDKDSESFRLNGAKHLVPSPEAMDMLLVSARDSGGQLVICAIDTDAPGVENRVYKTADGHTFADLKLTEVEVPRKRVLSFESVEEALSEVLSYADAVMCSEASAVMNQLVEDTVEHAKNRSQFGQPIARFQVIKHRLVEMATLAMQSECMAQLASASGNKAWRANVAAAKAFISESSLKVGHEAIQIHGGMGLTDELAVSHCHKRLVVLSKITGTVSENRDRFIQQLDCTNLERSSSALDFDCLLSPEESGHLKSVRDFFSSELDAETEVAVRRQSISWPDEAVAVHWQKKLNQKGWLAPLWPAEHGGTGWTAVERFLFEYESGRVGAPEQIPMGFRYVGPVIAHFGSDWQKEFFLPRLLASEHQWAQGFSEPGAGSDLAAIKTSAVRDGDDYVVNGTKIWTTNAHIADWIFCLVRTEKCSKPQQGISFLLIDMKSPGVSVDPIPLLAVDHEVNQVFFQDVRVPAANLVGDEGRGWEYAKFLLDLERGGTVFSSRLRGELNHVCEIVSHVNPSSWHDRLFSHRFATLEERLMALELYEFSTARSLMDSSSIGVAGSIIKLLASELQKDITELAMDAAGILGLELYPDRPLSDIPDEALPGMDLELVVMPKYLNMRVASIYGGSSEVQREIIAKQQLELR